MSNATHSVNRWISGGEDNTEPPTPLTEFEPRVRIIELWEQDTGKGSDKQYLKLSPVITQGKIFVADNNGEVKAIDATNGSVIWNRDTDTRISGGPGANDLYVLVGTSEGEILAMSSETGDTLWRSKVSSEVLAAPQESNNIAIVRTGDGKIYGLNATDGARLWAYDRTVPALTLRGTSTPVIAGDLVIAGFDGGRLAAIELQTGKLIWETRIALGSGRSELERMVDIDAEPLVLDDIIYVATFQGRIAAVALETGRMLWARDISSYAGLCADSHNLYVTDDNSHVWALDRISGSSVWKQEKLQARAATAPASISDWVVVGDLEGYLHWMDKKSGQFVARTRITESKIIAPPIAADEILYAYASDGTLGAYTYHSNDNLSVTLKKPETEQKLTEHRASSEAEPKQPDSKNIKEDEQGFFSKIWDSLTSDEEEDSELHN